MTIIVDANCSSDALGAPPKKEFLPIIEAFENGQAKLVLGGTKLKKEYHANGVAWRRFRILDQAGRAKLVNDADVDKEEEYVKTAFLLQSDDPHILALARVSGARLLCSRDQALHADFDNGKIINKPRGYIYQSAAHKNLIKKCC